MTEVSVETCLTNSKVLSLSLNSDKLNIFHLIKKEKKMAWAMPIQGLEKKKYEKKPNTMFMTSQRV